MCECLYVCVCEFACVFMRLYENGSDMCVYWCVCIYVSVCTCKFKCLCSGLFVSICIFYVCLCVCVFVFSCVSLHASLCGTDVISEYVCICVLVKNFFGQKFFPRKLKSFKYFFWTKHFG